MAVAQAAIDRYLEQPLPIIPEFKHADPEMVTRTIYNCTGQNLQLKTPPRGPHQLEGLAFALYLRRALLFYEMRIGKTWIALNWAAHLKRANLWRGKGLVIAHSPLGLTVWQNETEKHSDLGIRAVHLDFMELCDAIADDKCDLIVIPWSGLQEMFTVKGINRKGEPKLYHDSELIKQAAGAFSLSIVDETHMAMHHTSLRFKIAALMTTECKFALGLTGTPFGRNPYSLWAEAFLVDRGMTLGHNYYFFEQAFGGKPKKNFFSGRPEWKFDKRKLPLLKTKMSSLAMYYERKECATETIWSNMVNVNMAGDQREAYYDVIQKLIKLDGEKTIEILATFHRLRQVASGYLPFSDDDDAKHVLHFKSNAKLDWLTELVQQGPQVQIVIFHEYTHTGELICRMLTKQKKTHGWLYGGVKDHATANKIVKDFQTGDSQYLVANSAKGGMSIDLPTCDYLVFFEGPCSPIIRQQAAARPMARTAQDPPLIIDDLIAAPVDKRILDFQAEGRDLMQSLRAARRSLAK